MNQYEAMFLFDPTFGNTFENCEKEIRRLIPMYASLNGRHEAWLEMSSTKSAFDSRGAADLISFYPVVATEDLPADPDYPFTAIVGTRALVNIIYGSRRVERRQRRVTTLQPSRGVSSSSAT